MASAFECLGDFGDVDFLRPATRDQVNAPVQADQEEQDGEVLQLDHFLRDDGQVAHIAFHDGGGDGDLDAVDIERFEVADEVVHHGHLLLVQPRMNEIGNDVQVGPHFQQRADGEKVLGDGHGGNQQVGVLINAQGQQGRLFRRQGDVPQGQDFEQHGGRGASFPDFRLVGRDFYRDVQMMVVNVDLHPGLAEEGGKHADPAGVLGVHHDQQIDRLQIDVLDPGELERMVEAFQILLGGFFHGAGENHPRAGIQLLRGHHGGEAIEIGVDVRRDHLHGERGDREGPRAFARQGIRAVPVLRFTRGPSP